MTPYLWENFDQQTLEKLMDQTAELKRDPKEREAEKASTALTDWMGNNRATVDTLMDMDFKL